MAQGLPQCKASSLGVWGLGSDLGFRVQGFDIVLSPLRLLL